MQNIIARYTHSKCTHSKCTHNGCCEAEADPKRIYITHPPAIPIMPHDGIRPRAYAEATTHSQQCIVQVNAFMYPNLPPYMSALYSVCKHTSKIHYATFITGCRYNAGPKCMPTTKQQGQHVQHESFMKLVHARGCFAHEPTTVHLCSMYPFQTLE